jgi:putative salt-induced outer membrane protein YdiY
MKRYTSATMILIFFIALLSGTSYADEVRLKNGDRLTGKVKLLEEGKLLFETPYAGEITIIWSKVSRLKTDGPIKVVLHDETVVQGTSLLAEDGKMRLETEEIDEDISFDLADLKFINPEPPGPAVKISARANVGVDVKKGNTETESYHLDGSFQARTKQNRFKIGLEMNNERDASVKTAQNWLVSMNYDHFLSQKWYVSGNTSFENDEFKDLNLRTALGIGAGYQIFETPVTNFSGEMGLSQVNEDFEFDEDASYLAGRIAFTLERGFWGNRMAFFHNDEALISLEDTNDITIRTRTGFRFPFNDAFNLTVQYNWDWDKTPAIGQEKTDEQYLVTLGYEY